MWVSNNIRLPLVRNFFKGYTIEPLLLMSLKFPIG